MSDANRPGHRADPNPEKAVPAAARSGSESSGPPRRQLLGALIRPGKGQLMTAALLLVLGFGAVTQLRVHATSDSYAGARQSDLVSLLTSLSLSTSRIERQINRLTETRDSLQSDSTARQTALKLAKEQADTLAIIAGTIPVTGPGVHVTIHDPKSVVSVDTLLNGVSELRDAGAEAISINGTRVVASTAFSQSSDGHLVVDGTALENPYVIDVIGDSQTLRSAINFEGGFAFDVRGAGARLSVETSNAVDIAAVVQVSVAQYATPVSSE